MTGKMGILVAWLLNSLVIIVVGYLLPGIHISSFLTALAIALVLTLLNFTVRPILILLTLPLTILTMGLFLLVINALIILLTSAIVPGFEVDGFWWALLFGFLISIVHLFVLRVPK